MSTVTLTKTDENVAEKVIPHESLSDEHRDKAVLDARYRCDRCGAQAYWRTILESDNALYWCGHHAAKYIPVMTAQGVLQEVYDEAIRLQEDRKKGSEN